MPSMFKKMATSLVNEVGKKNLKPVSNLSCSHRFRPFCLLRKKYKKNKFTCTEFSLMDILEPHFPVPEVNQENHFEFWKKVYGRLGGAVLLDMKKKINMKMGVSAGAEKSDGSFLELQILTVSYQTWRTLQMERKMVTPEPSFIGELRSQGEDLYVVIEAIELLNNPVLGRNISLEGAGTISIPDIVNVKGQSHGSRGKQKLMTIPPHSILAYRAAKLSISENSWEILYFLDEKQKTFQNRRGMRQELHVQPGQCVENQEESGIAMSCDSEDESTLDEEFLSLRLGFETSAMSMEKIKVQ
ncbi:gasdermin-D-like [Monodelphis domestica]|uniref:gasdermin-D-like n=1 Tax=Monodelphis domestica TaxID=13616 RepID=UPI0004432BE7|nr:gasdermin-D-like [Monodelphis domestica]XP_056679074.1 gasdermin-D-like [Monodelphis domestica]XP_056679075.1 gasdermin-D-like [Monodelphis domestica]